MSIHSCYGVWKIPFLIIVKHLVYNNLSLCTPPKKVDYCFDRDGIYVWVPLVVEQQGESNYITSI